MGHIYTSRITPILLTCLPHPNHKLNNLMVTNPNLANLFQPHKRQEQQLRNRDLALKLFPHLV